MKSLLADRRGAVLSEFVVVSGPLFVTFFSLVQLSGGYTSKILVEHAARVAARTAIVTVAPNPGASPRKAEEDVRRAAELALGPFAERGHLSDVRVRLALPSEPHGPVGVEVSATYTCAVPIAKHIVCDLEGHKTLTASSTLTHQGASYKPYRKGVDLGLRP